MSLSYNDYLKQRNGNSGGVNNTAAQIRKIFEEDDKEQEKQKKEKAQVQYELYLRQLENEQRQAERTNDLITGNPMGNRTAMARYKNDPVADMTKHLKLHTVEMPKYQQKIDNGGTLTPDEEIGYSQGIVDRANAKYKDLDKLGKDYADAMYATAESDIEAKMSPYANVNPTLMGATYSQQNALKKMDDNKKTAKAIEDQIKGMMGDDEANTYLTAVERLNNKKKQDEINETLDTNFVGREMMSLANSYTPLVGNPASALGMGARDERTAKGFGSDVYSPYKGISNAAEYLQQKNAEQFKTKAGQFGYGVVHSAADSAIRTTPTMIMNALTGGSAQKALEAANLTSFYMSAKDSAYKSARERGFTEENAQRLSSAMGLAEAGAEVIGMDTLMNNVVGKNMAKNVFANIAKGMAAEGAEEGVTDIANDVADAFFAARDDFGSSEFQMNVKAYEEQGMTHEDALKKATMDRVGMYLEDIAAGALSGGLMQTVSTAAGVATNKSNSDAIVNYNKAKAERINATSDYAQQNKAQAEQYASNPARAMADSIDASTEAGKVAKETAMKLAEKEASGKKLNAVDRANLQNAMQVANEAGVSDSQKRYEQYVKETSAVPEEYRTAQTGITYAEGMERLQEAADSNDLKGVSDAYNLMKNSTDSEAREGAEMALDSIKGRSDLSSLQIDGLKQTTQDMYLAGLNGEERGNLGVMSANAAEAYNDGRQEYLAKIKNNVENADALRTSSVDTENGTVKLTGKMVDGKIETSDGSFINVDSIKDNNNVKKLYMVASSMPTNEMANTFISNINDGDNIETYIGSAKRIMKDAESGVKYQTTLKSSAGAMLDSKRVEALYNAGKAYAQIQNDNDYKKVVGGSKGKITGFTNFSNSDIDTFMFEKLAEKMGYNIELHNADAVNANGKEIFRKGENAKIVINKNTIYVNADNVQQIFHELGEFAEAYNSKEYDELRMAVNGAVAEKMGADDFASWRRAYKEAYTTVKNGKELIPTDYEVSTEMANDAIVNLFNTEEGRKAFANYLADNYSTTQANKIKNQIKDMFNRIVNSIKSLFESGNLSGYQKEAALKNAKQIEENVNAFIKVFDTAIENYKAQNGIETSNIEDTRSSLAVDSSGKDLTEGQKEYFRESKVLDENGALKVMHHGTSAYGFDVFDIKKAKAAGLYGKGFYFSDSDSHAGTYGQTYDVYLNLVNPLQVATHDITEDQLLKFINEVANDEDYGIENYGYDATPQSIVKSLKGKDDFTALQDINATCIGDFCAALKLFNKVNGTSYDGIIAPTETVAFYANQIKEIANENPTASDNIRFSMSVDEFNKMEKNATANVDFTKDLIAVHNLSVDQLLSSIDLGGLPSPSIAIIKAGMEHGKYGDVSILFNKNTIDPEASKNHYVYSGDAWTPTFPRTEVKINEDVLEKVASRINSLVPDDIQNSLNGFRSEVDNVEDKINRENGDVVNAYLYNDVLKYAYLTEKGVQIEPEMRDAKLAPMTNWSNEQILAVAEVVPQAIEKEYYEGNEYQYYKDHSELVENIRQALNKQFNDKYADSKFASLRNKELYEQDDFGFSDVSQIMKGLANYYNKGITQEADPSKLGDAVRSAVTDEEDFKRWISDLFKDVVAKRGLRNNKDVFLPSGNRRSWDALHDEYNLSNIVKIMKEQEKVGADSFFGNTAIKALALKKFSSIEDMHKSEDLLRTIPEDEYSQLTLDIDQRIIEIAQAIQDPKQSNSFIALDDAVECIADALKKSNTVKGIDAALRKNTWLQIQDDTAQKVYDLVNDISNMPTGYFEAKPMRAVWLEEIAQVILPSDVSRDVLDKLNDNGISWKLYEAGNEYNRASVIEQFSSEEDDTRFSLRVDGQKLIGDNGDVREVLDTIEPSERYELIYSDENADKYEKSHDGYAMIPLSEVGSGSYYDRLAFVDFDNKIVNRIYQFQVNDGDDIQQVAEYAIRDGRVGTAYDRTRKALESMFGKGCIYRYTNNYDKSNGKNGRTPKRTKSADFATNSRFMSDRIRNVAESAGDVDNEYAQAVKSLDFAKAQRLVDRAAKAAGYNVKAYHGSRKGDITIFRTNEINSNMGSHFGSLEIADGFANGEYWHGEGDGRVYSVYLKATNPFETYDWFGQDDYYPAIEAIDLADKIGSPEALAIKEEILNLDPNIKQMASDRDYLEEGYLNKDKAEVLYRDFRKLLELGGYDSIKYENGLEILGDEDYIIQHPEQIKLADAVTYDNNGDLIPLSKRFDIGNEDIRYSIQIDETLDDIFGVAPSDDTFKQSASILEEGMKALKHREVNTKAIKGIAGKLVAEYASDAKVTDVTNQLEKVFAYLQTEDHISYNNVMRVLSEVATPIIEQSTTKIGEEEYNAFLDTFKGRTIKLNDNQKRAVAEVFGTYQNYRLAMLPISVSDKGEYLDSNWMDFSQQTGMLQYDLNDADQPLALYDLMKSLKPTAYNNYGADAEDMAKDLAMRIAEEYLGSQNDAKVKQIAAQLKEQNKKFKADLRSQYNDRLKEARKTIAERSNDKISRAMYSNMYRNLLKEREWKEKIQDKNEQISEMRAENAERIANIMAKNKQAMQQASERRKAAETRNKIAKRAKKLIGWVENPTEKNHIPKAMLAPVTEFLRTLDFVDPKVELKDGKWTARVYVAMVDGKPQYRTIEGDTKEDVLMQYRSMLDDGLGGYSTRKWAESMQNISNIYNEVAKNDPRFEDVDMMEFAQKLDPDLAEDIADMLKQNGKISLKNLDSNSLEVINKTLANITRAVTIANKAYSSNENIVDLGNDIIAEGNDKTKLTNNALIKTLRLDMMTPKVFFKLLGNSGSKVYDMLREGFNTKIRDIKEASEYMADVMKDIDKKKVAEWTGKNAKLHEFNLSNGTIRLTEGEIMSLYETTKREGGMDRVMFGIESPERREGKVKAVQSQAVALGWDDVVTILSVLTDEQKTVADKMQQYMAVECSRKGNEVAMNLYGYEKYTEDHYFPFTVDKKTTQTNDKNLDNAKLTGVEHSGFTKARNKFANNPLIMRDIFDVFTDHVEGMATYHGQAASLKDSLRWLNYKQDNYNTVKDAINKVTGHTMAESYVKQMLLDLNGSEKSRYIGSITEKLVGSYKAAAVGANIRVVLQQPTAIFRALSEVDAKYMLKAFATNPATVNANRKRANDQSMIMWWKSQGYYETSLGKSMREMITGQTTLKDKATNTMMAGAGVADDITWGYLYTAIEYEVRDQNKGKSDEEIADLINKRFDDVVDMTQVVDSTIHRSQYMRSKDKLNVLQTAFMAEPTKTYNMLVDAAMDVKNGDKKQATRIVSAIMLANIVNAAAQSFVDALRHKKDEEKWKDAFEKYYLGNLWDNTNPLNMIPVVKEVAPILLDAITGNTKYSSSSTRFDTEAFNAIGTAVSETRKLMDGDSNKTPYGMYMVYAKPVSYLTGIPLYNLSRDTVALHNAFFDNLETSTKKNVYADLMDAIASGKSDEEIKKQMEVVLKEEGTLKDIQTRISSAYKSDYVEAIESGNDKKAKEIEEIVSAGLKATGMNDKVIEGTFDEWLDPTYGYGKLDKAIKGDGDVVAETKYLLEGKDPDKIINHLMKYYDSTIEYNQKNQIDSDVDDNVTKALKVVDPNLTLKQAREDYATAAALENLKETGLSKVSNAINTGIDYKTTVKEMYDAGIAVKDIRSAITKEFKEQLVADKKAGKNVTQQVNRIIAINEYLDKLNPPKTKQNRKSDVMKWFEEEK